MIRSAQTVYFKLINKLHIVYLLYAVPMALMVALITPAFQNPDEMNHFARAEQVSRLEFVPVFKFDKDQTLSKKDSISTDKTIIYPDKGGFKVDKNIIEAAGVVFAMMGNDKVKITPREVARMGTYHWGSGYAYANFGNTAIYPPVVYIMPAVGVFIGKLLHMSIINTLCLSRLLNAALTIMLSFFALKIAKRSNLLLFIALLFPMTIAMNVSVSQDAVLISCAFLFIAIVDHVEFGDQDIYKPWQIALMVLLLGVIAIGKPPYVLFAFVLLFLKLKPRIKLAGISITLLMLFGWLYINKAAFSIHFAPPQLHVNAKLQVQHITHDPLSFIRMFFAPNFSIIKVILRTVVGVLGWLDLAFPVFYYDLAYAVFLLGVFLSFKWKSWDNAMLRTALIICVIATLAGVITAQYVTWTALGSTSLDGIQGRYFLPIYPFLALALSSSGKSNKWPKLRSVMFVLIIAFPLYTTIIATHWLNKRYYQSGNTQSRLGNAGVITSQKNQHLCTL